MSESLNDIVLNEETSNTPEKPKKDKKHLSKNQKIYYGVLSGILSLIVIIGGLFIFNNAYYAKTFVDGTNMYPTFNENVVDEEGTKVDEKYSKTFTDAMRVEFGIVDTRINKEKLERFKIYAFRQTSTSTYNKVRRLIGLPGETITYKGNVLYVNNSVVEEADYAKGKFTNNTENFTITVDTNKYFFMGDNRSYSLDSRSLGAIESSLVYGRLVAIEGTCTTSGSYLRNVSYSWPRFY